MAKPYNIIGQKFNRWTVLAHDHDEKPHKYFLCRCECGIERVVQGNSLRCGTTKSCGCHRVDVSRTKATTHGKSYHPAYRSWGAMRRRCYEPDFFGYAYYGARGITVCAAWREDFAAFWADMGPTWQEGLSIDRIDTNGNYEPGNCKWSNDIEQANNKRTTKWLDTPQGRMKMVDAMKASGLSRSALKHRVERGWPTERLFD